MATRLLPVLQHVSRSVRRARFAGAVVAGVGLYLTMENVDGAVLPALGWSA